jgi:hypothetical protein
MVAFKVLHMGSYALMQMPRLVLWNNLQSCHHISPDVINVVKMPVLLIAGHPDLSSSVTLSLPSEKRVTQL